MQFTQHSQGEVGIQLAFMDFINDDAADALQTGVCEQAAQQHPRSHKLHRIAPLILAPHGKTH